MIDPPLLHDRPVGLIWRALQAEIMLPILGIPAGALIWVRLDVYRINRAMVYLMRGFVLGTEEAACLPWTVDADALHFFAFLTGDMAVILL